MAKRKAETATPDITPPSARRPCTAMGSSARAAPASLIPNFYRDSLSTDGAAFMFSTSFNDALKVEADKAARKYGRAAELISEEFRRLLVIKVFVADVDATKISPTPIMDDMWHAAILDTKFYADLQSALGIVLHHNPSGASEQQTAQREKRLSTMRSLYRNFFATDPLAPSPVPYNPHVLTDTAVEHINIRLTNNVDSVYFKILSTTQLKRLMDAYCDRQGKDPASVRFLFKKSCERVQPTDTPAQTGMQDGDTIEDHQEQTGC